MVGSTTPTTKLTRVQTFAIGSTVPNAKLTRAQLFVITRPPIKVNDSISVSDSVEAGLDYGGSDAVSAIDLLETASSYVRKRTDFSYATDLVSTELLFGAAESDSIQQTESLEARLFQTIYPLNARALSATKIRVDFSKNVIQNSALIAPGTYQITAVTAGAAAVTPQSVQTPVGQTNPNYVELTTTEMTDGAVYELRLSSGLESIDAEPSGPLKSAFFAGIGDAPQVFLVLSMDANTCQVQFTEPMDDNASLRDPANYVFDYGLVVNSVESVEGSVVILKTGDQVPGLLYTLTVIGILSPKASDQITASDSVSGVII